MNSTNSKPFAEIVESSLHHWKAQSWQWDYFPSYGSLVAVEQNHLYYIGLVYEVTTGSMDPTRYPFPFQKTEQELKKEQPQIFEFLRTTFSTLALGYYHKGSFLYTAPPHPAKMHAFVSPIKSELRDRFFSTPHYLHRIFALSSYVANIDDLLIALLCIHNQSQPLSKESLSRFMELYSLLTGNEYRRIKLFLQQIPQIGAPL